MISLLTALAPTIVSLVGPIILWWLRRVGAKEEQIKAFDEAVKKAQKNRVDAARPSEIEAELEAQLREPKKPDDLA